MTEHDVHEHHHHHEVEEEASDVEAWFRKKNPRVAFIELKENGNAAQKDLAGIPLPIRMRDFLNGVETTFSEEIPVRALASGMVWMLAIDPTFRYSEVYRGFLSKATKDPVGFAMDMAMGHYREAFRLQGERRQQSGTVLQEEGEAVDEKVDQKIDEELEAALLSFRGAHLLDPHQPLAAVQYARLLWTVGRKNMFVEEANHVLEHVLAHDENNALANAALGDLNAQMGQFVKATSYYQRAMAASYEEPVLEELRDSITRIAPETAIENATYYLRRADYAHAIEALMKAKAESQRFEIDYYLGVAYQNTSNYEAAEDAFRSAIDKGGDFGDLHNGLVYALNAQGKTQEAIAAASVGLSLHPEDLRLLFNRAVLQAGIGLKQKALEDVGAILEYDDLSDELFNETMRLRETLLNEQ